MFAVAEVPARRLRHNNHTGSEPRAAKLWCVGPQILISITETNGEKGRKEQMKEERKKTRKKWMTHLKD
jgi:hypothetical protein